MEQQAKRDALRAAYMGAGTHPAAQPEVGEEVHYVSRRGGYLFPASVARVVRVEKGPTLVIARNIAGNLVTLDRADLYVDEHGRWVEGVKYA